MGYDIGGNVARADSIAHDIESRGYGVLPGFLSPDELRRMRLFIDDAIKRSEDGYIGLVGPDKVVGSGLDTLAHSASFRALIERIYEIGTGRKAPAQDYYQLLRCMTGRGAEHHSMIFHYDSYVLTVLLPVAIPTSGQTGDFLMLPNVRSVRSSYAMNLIDKVLLDNRLSQSILRKMAKRKSPRLVTIKLEPGSAYFFWGYRSIHTNQPCDVGSMRATALFHYVNPHSESALYSRLRS